MHDPLQDDPDFPSGPWTGFWTERANAGNRCRQDLHLTFAEGKIRGSGEDYVGAFTVHGHYDKDSREVTYSKHYVGAHSVHYRGFRESKGIWGTWSIPMHTGGGFQIWPLGEADGASESVKEEAPVPALARKTMLVGV